MACAGHSLDVSTILQVLNDDDLQHLRRKHVQKNAWACEKGRLWLQVDIPELLTDADGVSADASEVYRNGSG